MDWRIALTVQRDRNSTNLVLLRTFFPSLYTSKCADEMVLECLEIPNSTWVTYLLCMYLTLACVELVGGPTLLQSVSFKDECLSVIA